MEEIGHPPPAPACARAIATAAERDTRKHGNA
jgi:hypothetical protein